jgi:hypothetical protein
MESKDNFWRLTKWIIAIVAIIFILPYVLLGDNCYVRIHDNLEGEWIWLKLMADSHTAFGIYSWVRVPQVMQGIPRNVLPTGLSLNMLLVIWFGMYRAYIISGFIIHFVGFCGMVLLLRDYFVREPENRYIVWLCASHIRRTTGLCAIWSDCDGTAIAILGISQSYRKSQDRP